MAGTRRVPVVKAALTVALLLYAGLALGNGFDRLSADILQFERLVPGPLRSEADRAEARLAAAANQRVRLVDAARRAVRADPVDPASTSLLGGGLLLRGDNAGAERAFRVAARFGWRDVATQAYWYEAALEAGEMEPAADRLDALLRARPELPNADSLIALLENDAAGRAALERRLAAKPDWLPRYLQLGGKPQDLVERRALVLAELARRGTRLGCDEVAAPVRDTLGQGARRLAEQIWLAHCPGARVAAGLADPTFAEVGSANASPFGWLAPASGDVALDTLQNGARGLRVRTSASVSRLVLTQPVALSPGRYRLTGQASPHRFAASFGCNADPPRPSFVTGDIAADGQLLDVPQCARLTIALWVRPGGEPAELARVSLEPVR